MNLRRIRQIKNPSLQSEGFSFICDLGKIAFSILTKLRFENTSNKVNLAFFLIELFIRDLGKIQTCNLLSRNQVRYSVAPRGLID